MVIWNIFKHKMVTKMTQQTKLIDYKTFEDLLSLMPTELSPAEFQGIALGLLAWNNPSRAAQEWSSLLTQECVCICPELKVLFEGAWNGLKDTHYGLKLYLPCDEFPLYLRTLAISQWCRGFMFGLGLMGFDSRMLSNSLISEALQDISQIVNIQIHPNENSEECERDFFELVEYLRMATLLIYSEMSSSDQSGGQSAHGFH